MFDNIIWLCHPGSGVTDIVTINLGGTSDKIFLKVLNAACLWVDICHSLLKLPIYIISAVLWYCRQQASMLCIKSFNFLAECKVIY